MRASGLAANGTSQIAYEVRWRRGCQQPWLVLLMGLGFDRAGWIPVLPDLEREFRLVLIDNRGTGQSTTMERRFTVGDLATDVAAVLDSGQIASAHTLGVSLGGMIAQEVAVRYPARVDRLVLACTTPGWPFGYPMPRPSLRRMREAAHLPAELAQRSLVENALSPATLKEHPELVDRIIRNQAGKRADYEAWQALTRAGWMYIGGAQQSRIRATTLVVCGACDSVVDPRNSNLLAARIPKARLEVFPGLGHLLFWEDPARFSQLVTSFLTHHEAVG